MHLLSPNSCASFVSLCRSRFKALLALVCIGLSAASLHAAKQPTTVSLAVSSDFITAGMPVTLTASVKSNQFVTTGQIAFCNAAAAYCEAAAHLGTAQVNGGTASLKLILPPGRQGIYALYQGTTTYAGSSSLSTPTTVDVGGPLHSTADISRTGSTGDYTLTSAVSGQGRAPVTGAVSFLDAITHRTLASAQLSSAAASFTEPKVYQANGIPGASVGQYRQIARGDFDGDGVPDMAVISDAVPDNFGTAQSTAAIGILPGDPKHPGQFLFPHYVFTHDTSVDDSSITLMAVGDFNADGLDDLALTYYEPLGGTSQLVVLLNDPAYPGQLQQQSQEYRLGEGNPVSLEVADFNGDGVLDLLTIGGSLVLLPGDPGHSGWFQSPLTYSLDVNGPSPNSFAIADFNRDGLPDIAGGRVDGSVIVALNDPSHPGQFLAAISITTGGGNPNYSNHSVAAGDFNSDGLPDLVVGNKSGSISLVLNDKANPGHFLTATQFTPGSDQITAVAAGDFNGDGALDLAITGNDSLANKIGLLPGDPAHPGQFLPADFYADGNNSNYPFRWLSSGDLNGDGLADLIVQFNPDYEYEGFQVFSGRITQTATATHVNPGSSRYVYASYPGDSNYYGYDSCEISLDGAVPAAPVISGITVSNITETSATINWTTDTPSYGGVNYGRTQAIDSATPWQEPVSGRHSVVINNLREGTGYYYQVWSASYFNGCSHWTSFASNNASFVTRGAASTTQSTVTALSASTDSVEQGTPVALTATVTSSGTPVTAGEVIFCKRSSINCQDSNLLGAAHLTTAGKASAKLLLPPGNQEVYASFQGTTAYAASSSLPHVSTVRVLPAHASSRADISKSGGPGNYTLSSVVSGIGNLPPTGTVSFVDLVTNQAIATAPLNSSTLSFGLAAPTDLRIADRDSNLVARGDFDGDGIPDLAAARGNSIEILRGDPHQPGQFLPSPPFEVTQLLPITCIAAGDFNGDGVLDLALCITTNYQTYALGIVMGDPAHPGQFQPVMQIETPHGIANIAAADFNKDGLSDLAYLPTDSDGFFVQLSDPSQPGRFLPPAKYPTGVYGNQGREKWAASLHVADFNADQVPDVALFVDTDSIAVTLGSPAHPGEMLPTVIYPLGGSTYYASPGANMTVGDLNGDGLPDLAVTDRNALIALYGDSTHPGSFLSPTTLYSYPGNVNSPPVYDTDNPVSLWLGDFNGDGVLDLAAPEFKSLNDGKTYTTDYDFQIFFGDPKHPGQLAPPHTVAPNQFDVLLAEDLNGDGMTDLVTSTPSPHTNPDHVISTQLSAARVTATTTNVSPSGATDYVYASYSGDDHYYGYQSCAISLATTNPVAPVISNITASNVTSTSATISWTTNIPSYGVVDYGVDSVNLEGRTPWVNPVSKSHSFVLNNLTPGSFYYYQVSATGYYNGCDHRTAVSNLNSFGTPNQ